MSPPFDGGALAISYANHGLAQPGLGSRLGALTLLTGREGADKSHSQTEQALKSGPADGRGQPAPDHMDPRRSFQGLILTLQRYWGRLWLRDPQPYDMEAAGIIRPRPCARRARPERRLCAASRRPRTAAMARTQACSTTTSSGLSLTAWRNSTKLYAIDPSRSCMTSASSRTTGNRGRSGWGLVRGWRCHGSPISNGSQASSAHQWGELTTGSAACDVRAGASACDSTSMAAGRCVTYGACLQAEKEYCGTISPTRGMLFEQFEVVNISMQVDHGGNAKHHLMALPTRPA